jgi:hypothetical protein
VPLLYCPHYLSENRQAPLALMLAQRGGQAVACDDCAAMEIVGERYRIITSRPDAKAYFVERVAGAIATRPLAPSRSHRPLSELVQRQF